MPTRAEVYNAIDGERDYQAKWDRWRVEQGLQDREQYATVESWILWMEEYLARARKVATDQVDKTDALHGVRKVVALGVACMEYLGAPKRATQKEENETDESDLIREIRERFRDGATLIDRSHVVALLNAHDRLLESEELAWGLIANAYGGDWDLASKASGWKAAAERWRDAYHGGPPGAGGVQSTAVEAPSQKEEVAAPGGGGFPFDGSVERALQICRQKRPIKTSADKGFGLPW